MQAVFIGLQLIRHFAFRILPASNHQEFLAFVRPAVPSRSGHLANITARGR